MKNFNKLYLGLLMSSALLFLGACSSSNLDSKGDKLVSAQSMGIRKTSLFSEDNTFVPKIENNKHQPMSGFKFKRSFQDAPPLIAHNARAFMPITAKNNACLGCHLPSVAKAMGATPIPVSHFMNFRSPMRYSRHAHKYVKTSNNYKNQVTMKHLNHLLKGRYNCTQCHVPQRDNKLIIPNTFKAHYVEKNGASRSSWHGKWYKYGLKTLGNKYSHVTKKDIANKNSPAGKPFVKFED